MTIVAVVVVIVVVIIVAYPRMSSRDNINPVKVCQ